MSRRGEKRHHWARRPSEGRSRPAPPVTFGLLTEIDLFSRALRNVAPFSSFRTAKMVPDVPAGQYAYVSRAEAKQLSGASISSTSAQRLSKVPLRPELLSGQCTLDRGPSGSKPSCCGVAFSYRPYLPH